MLHLDLFLVGTTRQHKEVHFGFKLPDHNPHGRRRILVHGCLLLLLPGTSCLPGTSEWEVIPWKQYVVGARYLYVGYLS